ncbi:hypothetical protein FB451DRAFT_479760 [Mycena latifolia]|nr:hypothetical protein FB451DRAFT_479760 [Mycena latifolia]
MQSSSSSILHGALGQQAPAQHNTYSHATQQTYQSTSQPHAYYVARQTPPYLPPQTFQSDSRPQLQQKSFGTSSQSKLQQPHSYSQQRDSHASGAPQSSNSGPQMQSRPSATTHSQSYSQQGLKPTGVPHPQPSHRSQAPPQSRPPANTSSAQPLPNAPAASQLRQSQPPQQPSMQPNPVQTAKSPLKSSVPSTAPARAPSYGISPFAHNPAASANKAAQNPTPNPGRGT